MKKSVMIIIGLLGSIHFLLAQQVELVDRNWIVRMNRNTSDTTYVINFWATWCKPCVEEIPHFEKLNSTYKHKKVKVIMVSCDFKKQLESRVIPFVKNKKMESMVVFMNESNPNNWIDKVDDTFSGAIPATLIINGSKGFRYFNEGEITYEILDNIVKPLIQ
ncbi:MAG: TlpA disulfide reductase family protein [Bacteroidota bacterium]